MAWPDDARYKDRETIRRAYGPTVTIARGWNILNRTGALALLAAGLAGCATPMVQNPAPAPAPAPPPPPVHAPAPPAPITDAAGLRAAYGPPDFVRKETGAQLWRYDGDHCALFAFLYGAPGAMKLRHMDTLPPGPDGGADPACIASVKARAAPVS